MEENGLDKDIIEDKEEQIDSVQVIRNLLNTEMRQIIESNNLETLKICMSQFGKDKNRDEKSRCTDQEYNLFVRTCKTLTNNFDITKVDINDFDDSFLNHVLIKNIIDVIKKQITNPLVMVNYKLINKITEPITCNDLREHKVSNKKKQTGTDPYSLFNKVLNEIKYPSFIDNELLLNFKDVIMPVDGGKRYYHSTPIELAKAMRELEKNSIEREVSFGSITPKLTVTVISDLNVMHIQTYHGEALKQAWSRYLPDADYYNQNSIYLKNDVTDLEGLYESIRRTSKSHVNKSYYMTTKMVIKNIIEKGRSRHRSSKNAKGLYTTTKLYRFLNSFTPVLFESKAILPPFDNKRKLELIKGSYLVSTDDFDSYYTMDIVEKESANVELQEDIILAKELDIDPYMSQADSIRLLKHLVASSTMSELPESLEESIYLRVKNNSSPKSTVNFYSKNLVICFKPTKEVCKELGIPFIKPTISFFTKLMLTKYCNDKTLLEKRHNKKNKDEVMESLGVTVNNEYKELYENNPWLKESYSNELRFIFDIKANINTSGQERDLFKYISRICYTEVDGEFIKKPINEVIYTDREPESIDRYYNSSWCSGSYRDVEEFINSCPETVKKEISISELVEDFNIIYGEEELGYERLCKSVYIKDEIIRPDYFGKLTLDDFINKVKAVIESA